jgi:cytochrome c biogenesis protein CcmG, thiol:disulfide interchange protein DsbE
MKKISLTLLVICTLASLNCYSQEKKLNTIPSVNIKRINGSTINTDSITNDGKPFIISFWATWCKPCVMELNTIEENYKDWQKETGVKLIALSIDDARTTSSVGPFVNGKGWDYEVYLDPNGDFKRAMNVNMVPHTFLMNGKREIVDQHTSFAPGDEEHLYEKIKKVAAGQPLEK